MKKTAILALGALALTAAACMVRTSSIRLAGTDPLPAAGIDEVEIYLSEKDVPGEYAKLALIFAEEVWGDLDYADLVARMRVKAAQMGANGLILGEMEDKLSTGLIDTPIALTTDKAMRGLAIRVKKQ